MGLYRAKLIIEDAGLILTEDNSAKSLAFKFWALNKKNQDMTIEDARALRDSPEFDDVIKPLYRNFVRAKLNRILRDDDKRIALERQKAEKEARIAEIKKNLENFEGSEDDLIDYLSDNYSYLDADLKKLLDQKRNKRRKEIESDNKAIWDKYGKEYYDVKDHEGLRNEKCFKEYFKLAKKAIKEAKPNPDAAGVKDFINKWYDGSPEEENALKLAIYNMWLKNVYPYNPTGANRWKYTLFDNGSFDQEMAFKHFADEYANTSPSYKAYKHKQWEEREAARKKREAEVAERKRREKEEEEELKKRDYRAWYDKYVRNTISDPSWRGPKGTWSLD